MFLFQRAVASIEFDPTSPADVTSSFDVWPGGQTNPRTSSAAEGNSNREALFDNSFLCSCRDYALSPCLDGARLDRARRLWIVIQQR